MGVSRGRDRRHGGAPTGCDDDPGCGDAALTHCHRVVGDEPGPILDERRTVLREHSALSVAAMRSIVARTRVMASPKEAPLRADESSVLEAHSR